MVANIAVTGVEDILVTAEADSGRTDVVSESLEMGPAQVAEAFGITNTEDTQGKCLIK